MIVTVIVDVPPDFPVITIGFDIPFQLPEVSTEQTPGLLLVYVKDAPYISLPIVRVIVLELPAASVTDVADRFSDGLLSLSAQRWASEPLSSYCMMLLPELTLAQ